MLNFHSKQDALSYIESLEDEIQKLAKEQSLATLEHKLTQRLQALEILFSEFMDDINQTDIDFLKVIQIESQKMLEEMQSHQHEKGEEIIKYKNTGKRIRLYTDIAQQK